MHPPFVCQNKFPILEEAEEKKRESQEKAEDAEKGRKEVELELTHEAQRRERAEEKNIARIANAVQCHN